MSIDNPQPLWMIALVVYVPGLFWVGRTLALRSGADRILAANLAPGLGLAALLVPLHGLAYATGSILVALPLVVTAVGLAGWGLWLLGSEGNRFASGPSPVPDGSKWRLPVALLLTLLIAPTALGWAFHDELFFTGHMSITAELQNGVYPPRHLTFPQFELRYHYGFNLLCATVTALTRLDIDVAIDLITLGLWAYAANLLWLLGERLFRTPSAGCIMAVLVLFGGGLPFFFAPEGAPLPWHLLGLGEIDGAIINPPVVSYFFQHPWTLGLPFALVATHLWLGKMEPRAVPWHALAIGLLLAALSFTQVVLFASVGAALTAATFRRDRVWRWREGAWVAGAALVALALATQWGGVFAPAPDALGGDLQFHLGVADSLGGSLKWHLVTFGVVLPLGLAGLWRLPQLPLPLALLLGGSLAVINLLRHAHSWDISKFATVAALALAMAATATVVRLLSWGGRGRIYAGLALVLSIAAGVLFPVTFAVRPEGIPTNLFHVAPQQLDEDDTAAVNWLRQRLGPRESVYRRFPEVSGYVQQAGLPQPWVDNMVARHGYSPERIERRMRLLTELPADIVRWRGEGLRFLVIGPQEIRLRAHADKWIASGMATTPAAFGPLVIVDIAGGPPDLVR